MLEHFFAELDNATHNSKPAFVSLNESLSYKELINKINLACQYLMTTFKEGLIAIILPNTIETCVTILACLKAKMTFVSLDVSAPKNEIKKILLQLKPKNIISRDAAWITSELNIRVLPPDVLFNLDNNSNRYQTLYPDNNEAFVTLTSGSTGVVKGVVHTNYSLCEAITHVLISLKLEESHRLLCTISHPSNAFLRNMLACLIQKATFILGHNKEFHNVLQLINQFAPTHIRFSIKDLISFSNQSIANCKNIEYIQRCDYSGDVVPSHVINNVNQLLTKGTLVTSYAMSECGTIAVNPFTRDKQYQQLTGKIIENVKYRIFDATNKPVNVNTVGELQIKCSTMFKKYLHDDLETQNAFTADGWFKTGDFFSQTQDGFLVFQGRKKNIIIKDGKNINPEYIRNIIVEWPEIEDCVVIGKQSTATLQEPVAYCSLKNDKLDIKNFTNYMKQNLNSIWLPKHIYVMKSLPRTVFGKIDLSYIKNNSNQVMNQISAHILIE